MDLLKNIKPIKTLKVSEQVAASLKDLILEGKIKNGEKLPSEQALAKHFNVGRRSVREALQSLAVMGLVNIRQGEGTFVTRLDLNHYMRTLAEVLDKKFLKEKLALLQLLEVRTMLETQIGIAAARKAKEKDLKKMRECLRTQREALLKNDIENFDKSDLNFHQAIVHATGNNILIALYNALTDLMLESRRRTNHLPGVARRAFKEHKDIFLAIKSGSKDKIEKAVVYHLNRTAENFKKIFKSTEGVISRFPQRI